MQHHALLPLRLREPVAALAGQAHRPRGIGGARRAALAGQLRRSAARRPPRPPKAAGSSAMDEDGGAPAVLGLRAPEPAEAPAVSASTSRPPSRTPCARVGPPSGRIVPGGSVNRVAGSSVGRPPASSTHGPGNRLPSRRSRSDSPLVVIDVLMSIRIGSPSVGMPTATGSGVNTAVRPPNGATLAVEGSELAIVTISPRSVARWRKAARQPMWWLRRITTVAVPWTVARSTARSTALLVSQTPGSRLAVRGDGGPAVGDHVRLAARGHRPVL